MASLIKQPPVQPPIDNGAPPAPPIDLPGFDTDEGPMRRELRRQIAELESQLAAIVAQSCPWEPRQVNKPRGPAVQTGHNLEQIRDELLAELHAVCQKIDRAVTSAAPAVGEMPAAIAGSSEPSGRRVWRKLTRR